MIGVILAAGVGSRLRPITEKIPKCLVKVAGKPILEYQLDAYRAAGIMDIVVIVGYEGAAIHNYLKHIKDLNIFIIENNEYEETNNMYSLYLARERLKGTAFILNNADLVVDSTIVKEMVEDKRLDLIAVEEGLYNNESMKIHVDKEGKIKNISKQISLKESYGCSIDFYKFSEGSSKTFLSKVVEIIEGQNNRKEWTELAMGRLLQSGELTMYPLNIGDKKWVEIDNFDDLVVADEIFSYASKKLQEVEIFFSDLDGTLYIGDTPINGAREFVDKIRSMGKKLFFLSNNSSKSKSEYVTKLKNMGIESSEEDIILSTDGVIAFLISEGVKSVFVLGTNALKGAIERAGISTNTEDPEYIVVGYDTELTYEKLTLASKYLNAGVDMLATHPDISCPTPDGPVPDCGALQAMLYATTGSRPVRVFGKPDPDILLKYLNKFGLNAERAAIIGDRIYTDMEMARRAGMMSILVLSGETTRDEVEDLDFPPDVCLKNVQHMLEVIEKTDEKS